MRAIAIGLVFGLFALAKEGRLGFPGLENNRFEFGCLMVPVAEGLFFGETAGTPSVIFSSLQFDLGRAFKGDMGFSHLTPP
jgi:hypothetical protein